MIYVKDKFTNQVYRELDETSEDVARAILNGAIHSSKTMKKMPSHKRAEILENTSHAILKNARMLAETIAIESGKPIKYSTKEVSRAAVTMKFSGEEAKRIYGETIPADAEPRGEGKFAYYVKEPIGTVLAITPFNDPLNLVAHKLGPAIAAGNSIIIKPSIMRPLSALHLVDFIESSGLPDECASILIASGTSDELRGMLEDDRIKMVSFTGGIDAAADVVRHSGIKKYSMELGSNSPIIIWSDADLDRAIRQVIDAGFESQGQNCIHAQRVLIHEKIYIEVKAGIIEATNRLKVGNPLSEDTDVGPMINEGEAKRVEEWVNDSVSDGSNVLTGGEREGNVYYPTAIENVDHRSKIAQKEVFGPVMLLFKIRGLEEAINISNSVPYGLQAGVFTKDIDVAQRCIDELEYGGVLINQTSDFRADFMPFGGFKYSGLGREGIRFAIDAMTEIKLVIYEKNNSVRKM
jgi:glyceraldehyde-3-phosphate dehydrogenase (NADP+)